MSRCPADNPIPSLPSPRSFSCSFPMTLLPWARSLYCIMSCGYDYTRKSPYDIHDNHCLPSPHTSTSAPIYVPPATITSRTRLVVLPILCHSLYPCLCLLHRLSFVSTLSCITRQPPHPSLRPFLPLPHSLLVRTHPILPCIFPCYSSTVPSLANFVSFNV